METAYIGIGSNLGDRRRYLRAGVEALEELSVTGVVTSGVYETEPHGVDELQPRYLNMAARIETGLTADDLLEALLDVESRCGRARRTRNAARTLDLDILLYGRAIVDSARLTLPHPRMHARAFVLVPLAEIAPDAVHPVTGLSVAELRRAVEDVGVVRQPELNAVAEVARR